MNNTSTLYYKQISKLRPLHSWEDYNQRIRVNKQSDSWRRVYGLGVGLLRALQTYPFGRRQCQLASLLLMKSGNKLSAEEKERLRLSLFLALIYNSIVQSTQ